MARCVAPCPPDELSLTVTFPAMYPEVVPTVVLDSDDLGPERLADFQRRLDELVRRRTCVRRDAARTRTAEREHSRVGEASSPGRAGQALASLGGSMVYTLAAQAKEWLDAAFVEDLRRAVEVEIEAARKLEEEEERKVKTGTIVTPDVFFAWKKAFDAEFAARKAKERGVKIGDEKKRKLTGTGGHLRSGRRALATEDQADRI